MLPWGEVRMSDRVPRQMSEYAAAYPHLETGGIGLGRVPGELLEIVPSGPQAMRRSGTFGLDPDFLNERLGEARRRGLGWTAVWHVHPEGCPGPSSMDEEAARALLRDPETGLSETLLLPISMRSGPGSIETRFWIAEGPDADLHLVSPVIVSDAGHAMRASVDERQLLLDTLLTTKRDARIRMDVEALQKIGFVAAYKKHARERYFLRVTKGKVTLILILPPEYPLSPPDVFVEEEKTARPILPRELPSLTSWSSLRALAGVVRDAEKSVCDTREAEALVLRPKAIELVKRAFATSPANRYP